MATRALQDLDGGLGSCQAGEDLSTLADPCPAQPPEGRVPVMPRLADDSSGPHDSQEPAAEGSREGGTDASLKKTEKEPVTKAVLGAGKERLKAAATPRSPARRKAQAAPAPQRPPPPPPPSEELPWGDLSLNKCLVLASLLALLASAFQLCRDAVSGEAEAPAPVPERWGPPSSAPEPASPPPPDRLRPRWRRRRRRRFPGARRLGRRPLGKSARPRRRLGRRRGVGRSRRRSRGCGGRRGLGSRRSHGPPGNPEEPDRGAGRRARRAVGLGRRTLETPGTGRGRLGAPRGAPTRTGLQAARNTGLARGGTESGLGTVTHSPGNPLPRSVAPAVQ
ncbi:junctional sarcoplasmic reticulum protein 1 isoform X1 [Suricata suricatta]|uniref:junctional sarcoplasmic reticulum protein 1 isoform X1 n=1 Tax=Suricata suricatta TaxID=37032 RepID=UPI001155BA26|nr:junctional sarcoplasmic reticulum protein 1 isoform X1 [Suricata suricatta]